MFKISFFGACAFGTAVDFVLEWQVPAWKRNTLRITLTLVMGGLAVLLRNGYAYVAAFTGKCSQLLSLLITGFPHQY